jgi:hypothetical protein
MEIERRKLADLVPASYHPRKIQKPGDANYDAIKNQLWNSVMWIPLSEIAAREILSVATSAGKY